MQRRLDAGPDLRTTMIVIEDYKPAWPAEFQTIRGDLARILSHRVLRIDHIGSTAVPDLAAKDVIDIQVTVTALTPDLPDLLVAAGYRWKPHITHDHVPEGAPAAAHLWAKWFFNGPADRRSTNVHLRVHGNPNQQYPLLFRDYLRTHPRSAQSVALIKRQLAKHHADDEATYYDIKDPVYDLIWDAATGWARQTGWQPQP